MAKQFRKGDHVEWHAFQGMNQEKLEQNLIDLTDKERNFATSQRKIKSIFKGNVIEKQEIQKPESLSDSYYRP